ncbi:MATE family efflux transporter [Halorubellus salinus]|uniref:MATE family efflux transporter n=1 Tax=Halorubellus salinus TaxID=755309 RepID=UPI001D06D35F|nr:MATE family efflux transporter [Halorubellus salinus]
MDWRRTRRVWKRVATLSWPISVEQTVRTGMRTTDVFVTAAFSPAAVAAIGLADLYARFPLRVGLGLGGGAIALSSQDTGAVSGGSDDADDDDDGEGGSDGDGPTGGDATADADDEPAVDADDRWGTDEEWGDEGDETESTTATESDAVAKAALNRDEAVTQAVLISFLAGIPFVAFGLLFAEPAISLLGAPDDVARVGGAYLAIIFATAPARIVGLTAARALQGTGDTRTPMVVNVTGNLLNIVGSLVLGLGLFGVPSYRVVGVGVATAGGNVFIAVVLAGLIASSTTDVGFVRPRSTVVGRQLVAVSAPRIVEGLSNTLANFPFNALLLSFGTDVNAAYQIGLRIYQQVTGPLSRGFNVAASVVVGQALGEGDAAAARENGWATATLGLVTVGTAGALIFAFAPTLVGFFTSDPGTVPNAVAFTRTFGVAAPFLVSFVVVSGALQGASDTRTPLVARIVSLLAFYLGFSYVASVSLGWGVPGILAGVVLHYASAATIVTLGFWRGDWARRASDMLRERGSASDD